MPEIGCDGRLTQAIQEKATEHLIRPHEDDSEETATTPEEPQVAEFEELAMPSEFRHNLARWLVGNEYDAEIWCSETHSVAGNFRSFQPGTNFRGMDLSHPAQHVLNSPSGLRAASTVSLDSEEGPELAVENETPETDFAKFKFPAVQNAIDDLLVHYRETSLSVTWKRCPVPGNRRNIVDSDWNRHVKAS